jgi:hypothetical protein
MKSGIYYSLPGKERWLLAGEQPPFAGKKKRFTQYSMAECADRFS